jgi:hypothetical protein
MTLTGEWRLRHDIKYTGFLVAECDSHSFEHSSYSGTAS